MTDLRNLLSEARAAIESLEAIIEGEISRDWSDIFYADWLIADEAKSRIDAALAEKVGPVADSDVYEFSISHNHPTGGIATTRYTKECKTEVDAYKYFVTLLEKHKVSERTYYLCKWQFLPPTITAPADQWRRVDDWQPIANAPKNGERVLVCCVNGFQAVAYWSTSVWVSVGGAWVFEECRSDTVELDPTHWMPLPALPEADK